MARATGVHEGRDGWLFWLGADGHVPALWRDTPAQRLRLWRWRRRLAARERRARALGARFVQLFAPDKFSVYGDLAGLPGVDPRLGFGERMAARSPCAPALAPVLRALRARGEDAVLRTDSHWSPQGFREVYLGLCRTLDAAPAPAVREASLDGAPRPVTFDLGAKRRPPASELWAPLAIPFAAREVEANAVVRRNREAAREGDPELHKWSRRVLAHAGPGVDPRRVVVFGDSYVFDGRHGLGPLLGETFAEAHLLWSPLMDWGYLARVQPDLVIAETAERWVRTLARDDVDVDGLAQARVDRLGDAEVVKPTDVHVGRDGWLFWLSSAGHRATFYRHAYGRWSPRAWRQVARWLWRLAARARRCRGLGARFIQVFAPDKLSVYADKTAAPLVDPRCGMAARLARLNAHVLDLRAPLIAARAEGETYLRTDTHWTQHGYLAAYAAVCRGLGVEPAAHVMDAPQTTVTLASDLGRAFDPPPVEPAHRVEFTRRAVRREANALVELRERVSPQGWAPGLMVGSRIVFANAHPEADPRRVVVFGDSYSFHDTGLATLLAESFRELHILWSASLDWGYLARVRPDVVVAETAERFTFMIEPDGLDVDGFAAARAAAYESPAAANASA